MQYPELTLTDLTPSHIDTYLGSLRRTVASLAEIAEQWTDMDEPEQLHFQLDLSRAFGLRHVLGAAYQANRLSREQIERLADVDRHLLGQAAVLERVYGFTLRELVHSLFTWGTPLAEQSATVHIETTSTALAELVLA